MNTATMKSAARWFAALPSFAFGTRAAKWGNRSWLDFGFLGAERLHRRPSEMPDEYRQQRVLNEHEERIYRDAIEANKVVQIN